MRQKLIELLKHEFGTKVAEITADYLISKGATILPEGAIILTRAEIDALNEHNEKVKRELAREIFAEIEKPINLALTIKEEEKDELIYKGFFNCEILGVLDSKIEVLHSTIKFIAELKKKYTEEGK